MEINEQPLEFREAICAVRQFERQYKISSEELFGALDQGQGKVEVHADDLYEWRSYFEFTLQVQARLRACLESASPVELEEIHYAASACADTSKKPLESREKRTLAVAA